MTAEHKQERSTSEVPHPMQYKVRSGTTDSGREYEKKMLTLFAIRSVLEGEENIWIASNVPHVGAFDDIVLHYGDVTFLMQLKHKEHAKAVVKEAFKKEKGDFPLTKYYKDISSLKKSLDSDNNKPEFIRYLNAFDKLYFILFTNRDVDDYDLFKESNEQVLQFLNTSYKGKIRKILTHKLSSIVNLSNVDSCKDIYLFANQISVKHIDHEIQEEVKTIIRKFELEEINVKDVAHQFTRYIIDWTEGRFGSYYCLSKIEILRKLTEILLGQYQLNFSKEVFDTSTDTEITIWDQIMNRKTLTVVNYDQLVIKFLLKYISNEVFKYCGENISSWLNNLPTSAFYENHKSLKSQMLKIVSNRGKIIAVDIYKCLWLIGELPALLVIKNKQHYSDILKILKLCGYCYKVILINNSEEEIYLQKCNDGVKQLFSLEDLNGADRNNILQLTVALQGRSSVPLQHLVDESFYHLIKCNDIINILLGNFNIGNDLEPVPDYFIERKVSKVLIKSEVLEKVKDEKFVIEGNYEKYFQTSIIHELNISKWEDFDFGVLKEQTTTRNDTDFAQQPKPNVENVTRHTVHHLKVYDKDHFEWIASYGSTKNIRQFVVELQDSLENNILEKLPTRFTLVSGAPGMGKSMFLNYVARHVPATKWVLKIDLNSYVAYCRTRSVLDLKHLYNFSVSQSSTSTLSHKVFEKLRFSKDVILLLDAFDEISISYKEEITDMIKSLYNEGFHIYLTTRPHMVSYLEEQFDTLAITLKPFSENDQKQFLTKYFISRNEDIEYLYLDHVTVFAEKLLHATRKNINHNDATFTGIPLQCALLAEVFFEDCKHFLLSNGTFRFNESFDLLYLYRNFVNSKVEILRSKFGSSSGEILILLNNLQSLLALKLIFPMHKDIISYVETLSKCHYTNESKELTLLEKGGIVTINKNLSVSFVHRTFAEYIVAEWLAENFNSPDHNIRDYVKILMNERFSLNYKFLYIMFDLIVAKNCPLHLVIINGKTENPISALDYSSDLFLMTDKCNRSVLHLAALYGYSYPPLFKNTSQTEEAQSFLDSRAYDTDSILDVIESFPSDIVTTIGLDAFGYNPLDYALASFSLTVANKLYTKLDIPIVNISINLNRKGDYLGYCALQNYKGLFKVLLIYFATKDLFMNRVNGNKFVKSYYHHMFACYNFQKDKILGYINKFKFKTIIQLILTQGPKVFPWLNDHNLNLHISVIFDSRKHLCRLLENGVDVNSRDNDYNTPLHYAILHKNTEVLNILLQNRANVNALNLEKDTPLHFAVIAHDYSSKRDRSFFNNLKIHFGLKTSSSDEIIIELISKGANVNLQNTNGNTPLHLALLHKNEYLAELLLSKKSDARLVNRYGQNCLHLAALHGYNKIVLKLLSAGADIYKQDNSGDTALHHAITYNKLEIVKLLISVAADPNITNNYGRNCLHVASYYGHSTIVSEILPAIKDIEQQDGKCYTAFQLALQQNQLDTVKLLMTKGADANAQIMSGRNTLHVASCEGHIELAYAILSLNWDINQQDNDGFTSLQLAAQQNKLDMVTLLLSRGANPNIRNKFGRNCLHGASSSGHLDITAEILPKINDINQQDNEGFTSLELAVQQNKLDMVKLLLCSGANPNVQNKFGRNCLHEASSGGHLDIAAEILPKINDINQQDSESFTSLQLAVQQNKLDMVKLLLSSGANPNIQNKFGRNCLHEASCGGHTDIAAEVLFFNGDINQQDNEGFTYLQLAVQQNKLDIVRLLISKDANPNIRIKSGRNCLHEASSGGHLDIAAEILPKINDINQQDSESFTSLQLAVQQNKLDMVKLLLSSGANPNIQNKFGRNCLHEASCGGHTDIAAEVLFFNGDINQQDNEGFTYLQLAVQQNKLDIVRLLISKDANPNIRIKSGRNCLHEASSGGHLDIAAEILPKINDINQQDNEGFTSLELAVQQNKLDMVKLLLCSGANPNIQNKFGRNCLHEASSGGHLDIAAEILPKINDINQQDSESFTSLQLAVQQNKLDMVKLLLSSGANPNIQNKFGRNCLHEASCGGHTDIAAEVLFFNGDINQQDNEGFTYLQLAVQQNKLDIVRLLISKDANPNIRIKSGRNCLHEASSGGHLDITAEILPKINDINQQDNEDFTSLQLAVQQNKLDMVKLLLSSGANPNIQNKFGRNCLHEASRGGHTNIAAEVLFFNGDINQQDNEGFTSLQLAVQQNKLDTVRLLISKDANPNIRNKSGRNCLHEASSGGHLDITAEILPKINDANQQDNEGFTSLQLTVQQNKLDIVRLLISKDAIPNIRNKSGRNCLHKASSSGHLDITVEILPKINDINQPDNEGFTSLQLAVQQNKLDMIELLISKGAYSNLQKNLLHETSYEGHTDMQSNLAP